MSIAESPKPSRYGLVVCLTCARGAKAHGHPREGVLAYARSCGVNILEKGRPFWCPERWE